MNVVSKIAQKLSDAVDIVRAALSGRERIDSIDVFGRREFRRSVTAALVLLRDKKIPAWDTLSQHVTSIMEARRTTIIVTAHPAFILLDGAHAGQDSEHLAASIAQMTCSCQLHRQYEASFPSRPVPQDVYAGTVAQERCDAAYRECMRALGKGNDLPTAS